ncbi:MAG: diacylglycerol kinase family protein, partial [Actinomycetota bacterium]
VRFLQPAGPAELTLEAQAAFGPGVTHVVVAGGDGTVNSVVNALGAHVGATEWGLIPMGTGNDLARTLGLPADPVQAAGVVVSGRVVDLDVCRASGGGVERLFVNACMGGIAVEVDAVVDDSMKERLGALAFWLGGAKAAARLERFVAIVNGTEVPDCVAVGVGNGRTCGGGIEVWPQARPDDGVLDGCALPAASVPAAVRLAVKVKTGGHEQLPGVAMVSAPRIAIDARPGIELNVDGELVGLRTPATFEPVASAMIRVP